MGRKVLPDKRCFIICEISANHNQNFKLAVSLIKKAKECGADAVKFQAYTPDTITLDADNKFFRVMHPKWKGQNLYSLYKKAYTPWKWFKKLKKIADDLGLIFFATAFDKSSVDFLEELKVPVHKISSFELVDLPLIEYAAKTGKPLILSTGMAVDHEIKEALAVAESSGIKDITLLKCVSAYPASPKDMNLREIPQMFKKFGKPIGISDHTLNIGVSIAAVSLGAVAVEKHFTLSRKIKTPDSFFSMEPQEFKDLVSNIRITEQALGDTCRGLSNDEKKNKVFRRSLFVVRDIKKGELFTKDNIKSIRPGFGLHTRYYADVLGREASYSVKKATPLRKDMVSK